MKAIETYFLPWTQTKPSRIVATTHERGQRLVLCKATIDAEDVHAYAARKLADKMGWHDPLVGGGFPDGRQVWCFKDQEPI